MHDRVNTAGRFEMRSHGLPGVLITFSGTDGSGKTTTLQGVRDYATSRGAAVEVIRMPSEPCRALAYFRDYVEDWSRAVSGEVDLASLCLVCLGDRLMTVRRQILPLLESGTWVLCERYVFTPLAELYAIGGDAADRAAIEAVVSRFPAPDLGVVTTVAADEAIRRIRSRPEERDRPLDRELFARVVDGYLAVARHHGLIVADTGAVGESLILARLQPHLDRLLRRAGRGRPGRDEPGS